MVLPYPLSVSKRVVVSPHETSWWLGHWYDGSHAFQNYCVDIVFEE